MYYDEKKIDGIWYWRSLPDAKWEKMNSVRLHEKIEYLEGRIKTILNLPSTH